MNRFLKYTFIFSSLVVSVSCSTKKNTGLTRAYHNVTSRYNILFNGTESYKAGMLNLSESYPYDFTQLLPVFLYTNQEALNSIASQMDRAEKKATKLIAMHSLTVKPKISPDKQLSEKQKAFMNKKEYNKYVDEAYLLMGKAYFHKMEYDQAKQTFNYIVSRFPQNNSVFEARLWLAKLGIEQDHLREADDILNSLERNIDYPKHLEGELYATRADYFIRQSKYDPAIPHLIKAIEHTREKSTRMRFTYILAQLYARTGQNSLASETYDRVIKMNPPYQMTFNAKINRALTYQEGSGSAKDIEKQLARMLKDDKNIEFQDQIYYARGNLYYTEGDTKQAIKNYELSIKTSVENTKQKALTNLTLADIYYQRPDYVSAQAYYDSAVGLITPDYPNYKEIYTKSTSLNKLVKSINTIAFEDSVMRLSNMPEDQLLSYIDDLIQEEIRQEELNALQQEQALRDRTERMANEAQLAGSQDAGKWYFYNQSVKSIGKKEFVQVWGTRKLEDNWRRKNKATTSFGEESLTADDADEGEETDQSKYVTDKKKPEFYLQYIPLTDSAKEVSLKRVEKSLFNMAEVYGTELKDFDKAISSYEELLRRFPNTDHKLHAYYRLYTMAKETKDIERTSKYQQKIILEFPTSHFAKLMTNPNYIEELKKQEELVYHQYDQVKQYYTSDRHSQAAILAQKAMEQYPDHELYPYFDFIHTVSSNLPGDTLQFIKSLQSYIKRYPETDLSANAGIMIDYLQGSSPQVVVQQTREIAKELYSLNRDEPYYFFYITPGQFNFNQLQFNIKGFNLDQFDALRLEVKKVELGTTTLVLVQTFPDAIEAKRYADQINLPSSQVFRDVVPQGLTSAIISESNFRTLKTSGEIQPYLMFYGQNY